MILCCHRGVKQEERKPFNNKLDHSLTILFQLFKTTAASTTTTKPWGGLCTSDSWIKKKV